jgi:alkanesulfonate monooxygenase SsuD/methylene tetrahydromethanopterin reductase-like flavin-dependent oxidoreductase (luciferase family)
MTEKIAEYGTDTVIDYFVKLQVAGTPEQCYAQIVDIHRRTGNSHFVGVFSYAGMPYDEAERNMRLFAAEVMPALKKLPLTASTDAAPVGAATGTDVRALGF